MPAAAHAASSEEQDSATQQQESHGRSGECQKQYVPAAARAASSEEQDRGSDLQDFNDTSGECQKQHVPAAARAASSEEQDRGSDLQDFNDTSGECQKQHMPEELLADSREQQNCQDTSDKHQVQTLDQWTQWEANPYDDHTYVQYLPIGFKGKSFAESVTGDDISFYTGIKDATAQAMYDHIVKAFGDWNVPYKENMIGFAADGANVMMGARNSVMTHLRKDIPNLFVMKLICHSFHLCSSYACEKLPRAVEDETILQRLQDPLIRVYLEFLEFVPHIFTKLNKRMPSDFPQIHNLRKTVGESLRTIYDCYLKSSYLRSTPIEDVEYRNPSHFLKLEEVYLGAKTTCSLLRENDVSVQHLEGFRLRCLDFFIERAHQILSRFSFKDEALKLLETLDPSNVIEKKTVSCSPCRTSP
ncbi:hypothetical protein MTO96_024773 [Rhipicephalus appendiculatus]